MIIEEKNTNNKNSMGENFAVLLTNPMLYDRLHTVSVEYSVSVELLINVAVKRLLDDVDFMRSIRVGGIKLE